MVPCAIRILVPSLRGASGIATYTVSLVTGVASEGHEVVLLDETAGFQAEVSGITVVPLHPARRLPYPLEPLADWGLHGKVRRLAREFAVDGIHATRLGLVPRNEKTVITAWDPILSPAGRFRAAPRRGEPRAREAAYAVADAVAARRSGAVVAVTEAVREGFGRIARRCEFIPPFLEDDAIVPPRPNRPHDIVMVAGALDLPRKGLDLALQAVARVRDAVPGARLILIGDWIDSSRRASLPDFCLAEGPLPTEEVRAAFGAAGCCLVPSLWEEFGYAGLEALAMGTPVACSPLPGYEGLSGGGVFMAKSATPDQLARQAIAALGATEFEFPVECRGSVAIPRIVALQRSVFGVAT